MIIDCISDLHGYYPKLDGGDLLIVAGDLTAKDTQNEYFRLFQRLLNESYKKIIIVAGNHDNFLQKNGLCIDPPGIFTYLCDSGCEFEYEEISNKEWGSREGTLSIVPYEKKKLKIWGSPWTKTFEGMNPKCKAFTVDTEEELAIKFSLIPEDTDILITHNPPYGILDGIPLKHDGTLFHAGSHSLSLKVCGFENPPKLWVCGHIHEGYGIELPIRGKPCKMVNASYVNEKYKPINKPIRIEL